MRTKEVLSALRAELGITQFELASALHINISTVNRWENEHSRPNRSAGMHLLAYAKEHSVSEGCIRNLETLIFASRKEGQERLREGMIPVDRDLFAQLVEDASLAIYVVDYETDELLYVNQTAERKLGKLGENIQGKKCYEYLTEMDAPCSFCNKERLNPNEFLEKDIALPDNGRKYHVQGKIVQWNGRKAHVHYVSEITPHPEKERGVVELLKEFLVLSFSQKESKKALALLTEDIHCYGLAYDKYIKNIGEFQKMIESEEYGDMLGSGISFWDEGEITSDNSHNIGTVGVTLEQNGIKLHYRVTGITKEEKGIQKIYVLQLSNLTSVRSGNLFADLTHEKIQSVKQELLSSTTVGGMMGGYVEEGFPFYFINQRMLEYLGYEEESDFVQDIDGLIENCIHPEDRYYVNQETEQQIEETGGYEVEYRLRKKDKSYIWVHDVGKSVAVEDGRNAIISVCYDITESKEHTMLIDNLIDTMNAGFALFHIEENGAWTPAYLSGGVGILSGYTNQEYKEQWKEDARPTVYKEDCEKVYQAVEAAITEDKVTSIFFRVAHKKGGYVWINGIFSGYGKVNDKSAFRVILAPAPIQFDLQLQALDQNMTGIYVMDAETRELYYANETSFHLFNLEPGDVTGKLCEEVFCQGEFFCNNMGNTMADRIQNREFTIPHLQRTLSMTAEEKKWNERRVVVVYLRDVTELQQAKRQVEVMLDNVRQSEEIMKAACNFANIWVFTYDPATGRVHCGEKLQKEFGLPEIMENYPQSMIEYSFIPPEYAATYLESIEHIKEGRDKVEFEIQVRCPDGLLHWLQFSLNRLFYGENISKLVIGSARVIDVEKELEAQIETERTKLLSGDANLLGYVIANLNKNLVMEHEELQEDSPKTESGIAYDEAIQKAQYALLDAGDRAAFLERHDVEHMLKEYKNGVTNRSVEVQRISPSGKIMWMRESLNFLRDPKSGDVFLYEYWHDINSQKTLEELIGASVNYSYERFAGINLLNGQANMLYNKKERGKVSVEVWDYHYVSTEYGCRVVLPEDREMFLHNISLENVRKELEDKPAYEFMHRVLEEDGRIHIKRTRFVAYDNSTQHRIVLMTRADVTSMVEQEEKKRKELEVALVNAKQATQAKTDFLSRMSHDLRTPMNVIMGLNALTLDEADNPEAVRANMAEARTASDFMMSLINDILDMAKIEKSGMELHPVMYSYGEFLRNMEIMFEGQCRKKDIELHFRKQELHPTVMVDKLRLNQIFFNIFSNAVKYTPEGGRIDYYAENMTVADGRLTGDYVIRDNGVGMSEEFQKHMFDPFVQEDNSITPELQGSGLGLSITKQLVELMGGSLRIESAKGKGTTVTIHLVLDLIEGQELVEKKETSEMESGDLERLAGKNILLVEDHPMNAQIARKLLEKQKMQVIHEENGRLGVERFKSSEEGYFDAVLMDIRMPEMSGLEASRAIRQLKRGDAKTVPIIAMTANAYAEDIKKSKAAGMNAHLAKPINPQQLYGELIKYMKL